MTVRKRLIATALYLPFLVLSPRPAQAGDRALEVLVVNMTPDPVSEAASSCAASLRREIRADYTHMTKQGESAFRRAIGDTTGEDFMDYSAARLLQMRERKRISLDTIVLFDCRPGDGSLRALIQPPAGGAHRFELRRARVDAPVIKAFVQLVLLRAWIGFSP